MRKFVLFCVCSICYLSGAGEGGAASAPTESYLNNLGCRIVRKVPGNPAQMVAVSDVNLDTKSNRAVEYSFDTPLHGNRTLSVSIRSVAVLLPRDRFNVVMKLDGKPHMKSNHVDLDIYIETVVDDMVYALHCFRED